MTTLTEAEIDELRSFIVGSNLEYALLDQLDNPDNREALARWLRVSDEVE